MKWRDDPNIGEKIDNWFVVIMIMLLFGMVVACAVYPPLLQMDLKRAIFG